MCMCMCVCVYVYHPPSIFTLTHSLRSFVASPVQSYGGGARGRILSGRVCPYWFIERSSAVGGAEPPPVLRR
jgi:hypothetical protein